MTSHQKCILTMLYTLSIVTLCACQNTLKGVGQDMSSTGAKIEKMIKTD